MRKPIAILSFALITLGLSGCVYQPVPVAPPPPGPVVYYAPGYYTEPVYPAYGYYGPGRAYGRWR